MTRIVIFLYAVICCGACFAIAAQARTLPGPSMRVGYGDLYLAKSRDGRVLRSRIAIAARSVCRQAGSTVREMRDCMESASAWALVDVRRRMAAPYDSRLARD